jgi:WD40 repeat protein
VVRVSCCVHGSVLPVFPAHRSLSSHHEEDLAGQGRQQRAESHGALPRHAVQAHPLFGCIPLFWQLALNRGCGIAGARQVLNPSKKKTPKKKALGEALSADEMRRIEELFYEADEDGNGKLDIDEFVNTLSPVFGDPGIEKLTLMFRRMDANLDGEVDWDEFSTFMLLQSSSGEKEESDGNRYGIENVTDGSSAAGHGNHVAHVSQIAYSETHQRYYTGSLDGTVRTWSGKNNMAHFRTIYNEDGWINDICILGKKTPETEMLAVATNRSVSFYSSGTLELRSRVHTTASIDLRGSAATDGLEPPPRTSERAYKQGQTEELKQYKRSIEQTRRRKTCPQCLHAWMDDGKCIVAVGDDAGQVTLFSPPDPEMSHSKAVEIAKVEYQPSYWKHSQVMEWIKSLKLGDAVVEAFSRATPETTGQFLVEVGKKQPAAAKQAMREQLGITKAFLLDSIYKKIVVLITPGNSIPLHKDWITKMQYVPTPHQFFLSTSKDNTLLVTDIEIDWVKAADKDVNGKVREQPLTVRLRKILNDQNQGHHKGILDFAWCSGFKQIATCGLERHVQLWSPYGIPIGRLEPLSGTTLAVTVNERKSQIICLSADNVISVWDENNNRVVQTMEHQSEVAEYTAAQPIQRLRIEVELDREIRLKEEAVAEAARAARGGNGLDEHRVSSIFFHEEAGSLITGTTKLVSWQTRAEALANKTERSHGCPVCCASYNPYMQQVVSCDDDSNILVWDFETGNLSYRIDDAHNGSKISAMAFDGNGSCLLTGGHDGHVKLWNLSTGKLLKEMVRPEKLENDLREVTALLFRSTLAGSYIISGGWDRKVTMWADEERHDVMDTHVPKQKCYRQLEGHSVDIRCLAFYHPNTLASGCDAGEIILWNMDSGFAKLTMVDVVQKRTVLQTPNTKFYNAAKPQAVEQVTFLPTTAVVVACYADGWLRFWDSNRGTLLRRHLGAVAPHGRTPMALMVFPPAADELYEGQRVLMTGDDGGGIQHWDVTAWDDPNQLAAAVAQSAGPRKKVDETCPSLAIKMHRHWQAHTSGNACLSLEYLPPSKGRQAMVLSSGEDGDVTLFTVDGARVGDFRAKRKRNWQLDRSASFLETRCTTSIPIDNNPPRSARAAERAAAAEAKAAAEQAAADTSMAGLFSSGDAPAAPTSSVGPTTVPTVAEEPEPEPEQELEPGFAMEGEDEDEIGHDDEAKDIFAQLVPVPPVGGKPSAGDGGGGGGGNVMAGSGSGRLVMNSPMDNLGIGLRGSGSGNGGDNTDDLDDHDGLRWLDGCKDLAPSVTEVFRRPRGGDARVERDQRRAALVHAAGGSQGHGHGRGGAGGGGGGSGASTARGRMQTTKAEGVNPAGVSGLAGGGGGAVGGGLLHLGGGGGAQTARGPVQPQLAHGWVQKFTADGAPYYENLVAKTAQWERPVATVPASPSSAARFVRRPGTYQVRHVVWIACRACVRAFRACRACRACVCVVARELQLELSACLLLFCCAVQGALNIERHNVLSMEELRRIDQPPTRYKTDGGGGVSHLAQALVAPGKARLKGAFAAGVLR